MREAYDNEKADMLMSKIQYALSSLFVYYESCLERSEESQNTNSKDSVKEQGLEGTSEESKRWKVRDKYLKRMGGGKAIQKNELEKYLAEECEELKCGDEKFDVLGWWRKMSVRYPILSLMAKDILAVPLSTVASESAFSTGGRVLDVFRSSLAPYMVEALICAQDWLKKSTTIMSIEEDLNTLEIYDSGLNLFCQHVKLLLFSFIVIFSSFYYVLNANNLPYLLYFLRCRNCYIV